VLHLRIHHLPGNQNSFQVTGRNMSGKGHGSLLSKMLEPANIVPAWTISTGFFSSDDTWTRSSGCNLTIPDSQGGLCVQNTLEMNS
jgi:hypothetical protein